MDLADDIVSQLPLDQLAAQLGTDTTSAEQAVRQAVPALLGGLQANAGAGGADSLLSALGQHTGTGLFGGGVDLDRVDTDDGGAIVDHVFGAANTGEVAQRLAGNGGLGSDLIAKVLPIIAPIVLSWLAGKVFGGGSAAAPAPADGPFQPPQPTQPQASSGGGLGDLLGQVLGGALGGPSGGAAGGGLGGGLGDLLGGLLGQGRR